MICGTRGTADALLNLALFTPVGLLLGGRRHALLIAGAVGLVLSVGIETAQLFIPGRHPTLGDIVWNGLGGPVGVGLWHVLRARSHGSTRFPAWAGGMTAAGLGSLVLLAGWLLAPLPTEGGYWGQWTPIRSSMSPYRGELLGARLDGRPVPRGRFPEEWLVHEDLAGDWTIEVILVVGPPPRRIAPILTLGDDEEQEIVMLGTREADLVLRERTRAVAARLDQPDLRVPGALAAHAQSDSLAIFARRSGPSRCLGVESAEVCGLRWTPGRTWSLLLYPAGLSPQARSTLDALWMLMIFGVVGFLSVNPGRAVAHGAVLTGLVSLAPFVTRLHFLPALEVVGALAGLGLGYLAGALSEQGISLGGVSAADRVAP